MPGFVAPKRQEEGNGSIHALAVFKLSQLITRANLLGHDFGQGETGDGGGCKWQVLKVALLDVSLPLPRS
jgi:hypothetical protein